MANIFTNLFGKKENRQPLSNTTLLLTITICTFIGMYVLAMIIWGGGFLNPQQFLDLFNNNAYLIVIACGLTIVMITGGIDISVGGSVALITMASVVFMEDHGGGIFSSILISLGIGLAVGLVQGYLVAYLKIQPFIVSLAGMFFTRGMTTIVSKVPRTATNEAFIALKEHYIDIPFLGTYSRNGTWIPSSIEVGVIIAIVVVIALWAMLKWTRFGRNLYAVGGNSESALMLGINVRRTQFFAYVLCGLLAGIAGFCYLLHTGAGNASMQLVRKCRQSLLPSSVEHCFPVVWVVSSVHCSVSCPSRPLTTSLWPQVFVSHTGRALQPVSCCVSSSCCRV